jgi:hypothetical protein
MFAPVQAPIEGRVDSAQLAAGEETVEMFHTVPGQDRHPVAFTHGGRTLQPVGQPIGPLVQLSIREPQFRLFAHVDNRQLLRRINLSSSQVVSDIHRVSPVVSGQWSVISLAA